MFQMVDIRRGLGLESVAQWKRIVEAFIAVVGPSLPRRTGGGRRPHSRVSVSQPRLSVLHGARHVSFLLNGPREFITQNDWVVWTICWFERRKKKGSFFNRNGGGNEIFRDNESARLRAVGY